MILDIIKRCDFDPSRQAPKSLDSLKKRDLNALSSPISALQNNSLPSTLRNDINQAAKALKTRVPVLGITGTGGSGKSSLTDEVIRRGRREPDFTARVYPRQRLYLCRGLPRTGYEYR